MSQLSDNALVQQAVTRLAALTGGDIGDISGFSTNRLLQLQLVLLNALELGDGSGGPAVDQTARDAASQAQQEVDALEEVVADLPDGATDQQARDAVAALKTRTTLSKTTAPLAPGSSETFTLAVPRSFTLLALGVSAQARVRAYGTAAARTADEARAFGSDPTDAVYPALDLDSVLPHKGSLSAKVNADFSPNAQGEWFMRVTNTGSSAAAIMLSLAILPREAVS